MGTWRFAGDGEQRAQLGADRRVRQHGLLLVSRKDVVVLLQRLAEIDGATFLEAVLQGVQRCVDGGEIEAEHHVSTAVRGRRRADFRAAEQRFELVSVMAAVVALQHRKPARLAETPWPDEQHVVVLFQSMNEAGLVDIQAAVEADAPEVRPPVGNPRRTAFGQAGLFNACLGRRGHGAASAERLRAILHERVDGACTARDGGTPLRRVTTLPKRATIAA